MSCIGPRSLFYCRCHRTQAPSPTPPHPFACLSLAFQPQPLLPRRFAHACPQNCPRKGVGGRLLSSGRHQRRLRRNLFMGFGFVRGGGIAHGRRTCWCSVSGLRKAEGPRPVCLRRPQRPQEERSAGGTPASEAAETRSEFGGFGGAFAPRVLICKSATPRGCLGRPTGVGPSRNANPPVEREAHGNGAMRGMWGLSMTSLTPRTSESRVKAEVRAQDRPF